MAARHQGSRAVFQFLRSSTLSRTTSTPYISRASCRSQAQIASLCTYTTQCRYLTTTRHLLESSAKTASSQSSQSQNITSHRKYTFPEIQSLSQTPRPNTILIDVRETHELKESGKIPTALNLPLKTSPDFAFLNAEEFEDRFGRPRPGKEDEVIFYCRSGVRSKAAAELAKQAGFGGTVSEFPGSWLEWEKNGGTAERA